MMERGIKKTSGCSLMELNGNAYEFVAGDQSHPQSKEIYAKLENMMQDLIKAGYSPDTSEVFLDLREVDKETTLYRHSEKLAIAYALLKFEVLQDIFIPFITSNQRGKELVSHDMPKPNIGIHRFVFVLFKQKRRQCVTPPTSRDHFNTRKFAVKNDNGLPVAACCLILCS
ncbi:Pentatricopeptide repeat-containing protein [Spatholobus suberectus]|nr:Pentatricopeptide repeat-containing protein [Spatholobus suberectus]